MNKAVSEEEIASLVEPTRIHKRAYVDPDIFELEMEHRASASTTSDASPESC